MATVVLSNSGTGTTNAKNYMKLRITYSTGGGVFTLTKIEGCRTDGTSTTSSSSANKIYVSVAGVSVTLQPANLNFNKNSSYSTHWSGSQSWSCSGNVAVVFTFKCSATTNISGAKFQTTVSVPPAYTYPWWTVYNIHSFGSTAYVNMPYSYNVELGCNYGSSGSNNLLYWEGFNNSGYLTILSTTGASIGSAARTYTFGTGNIGSWTFRGVIRYTDPNGNVAYNVHGTTFPLTISWLNPTLTNASHKLNKTSFYRSSTVQSTSTGKVTSNSASPSVYVYFSDTNDATGDSGAGYYKVASYGAAATNTFTNVTKSYTHRGDRPGKFYTEIVMNGNNSAGTWSNFTTVGRVEYTMQQFVAPTATRTVTYNKNNVYVGQTQFPITVKVTAVSKSQYDTLTPTFQAGTCKNGSWSYDSGALKAHNFAVGTYNLTLVKKTNVYAVNDKATFRDEMVYKNALNANAYQQQDSAAYTVKAIPTPTSSEVSVALSNNASTHTFTATITSNFNTDFIASYTLYFENSSGKTVYSQTSSTIGNKTSKTHTYVYDPNVTETYRARLVVKYTLAWETGVAGSAATINSGSINIIGKGICIKHGSTTERLSTKDAANCNKPRLGIKYGNTIKYVPLYTGTPPTGVKKLMIKKGSTQYYALLN